MVSALAAGLILAGSAVLPRPGLDLITSARYPDAHSVVVDRQERVRYNPDGTFASTVESWTKVLTERGRREESTISLEYSKRYGEASIDYVGAIDAEGHEREIDVGATLKESTDNGSMSANIYDPLDRRIVCTVPGLKVGETLHVRTSRKALHPRCEGQWADLAVMEWSDPIVRSTYEVTAPAARPLGRIQIRHPLGNLVTNVTRLANGDWVYSFTATNSPQAIPEPDMPALYTQVQNVRVSTAVSWEEISKWYWQLSGPHLAKTSVAMTNRVQALTGGTNRLEKLRSVFRFVSQEIRYMGLTLEDVSPGYAPHDVDLTFDNRYGVCRDKAALLVALLRIAGFQSFPVLIQAGAKHDPEVPQPFFNHAIVAVEDRELGEGYLLMDPTDENTKDLLPSYLSDKSYLVCRPEGERLLTTPVPDPRQNELTIRSQGSLAGDGSVSLTSDIAFGGINDTAYRHTLVRQRPEDRVKIFERIVKAAAPGAELTSCRIEPEDLRDTETALAVRLSVRIPECVLKGETRSTLTQPFLSARMGVANFLLDGSLALPQRKYPLVLGSTARVRETTELDLGGHLGAACTLPDDATELGEGYRFVRRFNSANGVLRSVRELTVGAIEFSPREYGDLLEAVKESEAAARRRPIFEMEAAAGANVRRILEKTDVTVGSEFEWTVTNRVVKEVLTYEGKKRASELSWSFNPTWKKIEVLEASVSNRDGRVCVVTPKEMNVMDCGWAASAPRYPASRQLVVNLPAVEIGSVISYTVVTTVSNAPAPFYGTFAFDSSDPIGRISVRVNDWRREVVNPRRLENEPNQPPATLWRNVETVSFNDFRRAARRLRSAEPMAQAEGKGRTLEDIRRWLAKNVKVTGPGLYELPLELQLTDPAIVLKERYATRLDYVRTLVALLKGAGYEASLVFAADDADDSQAERRRTMYDKPNVRAFSAALARVRDGENVWFLGTENQYAPLGPSAFAGATYLDPATGEFQTVRVAPECEDEMTERTIYEVRADGAVDLTVENTIAGSAVASFRKTYSEILPEMRQRRHQSILGDIAQAATATSELETDVEGYPAVRRFSCYIPDFATVDGDLLILQLPPLLTSLPALTGRARKTPFVLSPCDAQSESVEIRLPKGFTAIEHLPEEFEFVDLENPHLPWIQMKVNAFRREDQLTIRLCRTVFTRPTRHLGPQYYELIKDWNRISSSVSGRTIIVRKTPLPNQTNFCYTNKVFVSREATLAQ